MKKFFDRKTVLICLIWVVIVIIGCVAYFNYAVNSDEFACGAEALNMAACVSEGIDCPSLS